MGPANLKFSRHLFMPVKNQKIMLEYEPMNNSSSDKKYFDEQFLSLQQIAANLGISSRQVYRLIHSGLLPAPIKIGKLTRIVQSEFNACIEKLKFERRLPNQP